MKRLFSIFFLAGLWMVSIPCAFGTIHADSTETSAEAAGVKSPQEIASISLNASEEDAGTTLQNVGVQKKLDHLNAKVKKKKGRFFSGIFLGRRYMDERTTALVTLSIGGILLLLGLALNLLGTSAGMVALAGVGTLSIVLGALFLFTGLLLFIASMS